MIDVEHLAELRHPSVLISSPLSVGAAAQRLRRGVENPGSRYALDERVEFEDSVELWARPRRGPWLLPWKLRAELVAVPGGCELRGAVTPFNRLWRPHLRYGFFLLWILGSLLGAFVAWLAGAPQDARGAAVSAGSAALLAAATAALDYLGLRLNRPAVEYLLARTADTLEAGSPPGADLHNR